MATVRKQSRAGHTHEHREVPYGRIAVRADVGCVDVIKAGMGPQPADRALAVLQCGRERRLSGEAIVDRDGDEAQRGEIDDVAGDAVLARREARLISLEPPASMD